MGFTFQETQVPGVILVTPRVFSDQRGFFMETYKKSEFQKAGITCDFMQENHSLTLMRGIVRGLHFQKEPFAQAKLVRCVKGAVFDVAVDLRPGSATYGKFASATLSEENKCMLMVPRGFAHGFQAVTDDAQVLYKTDNEYSPQSEGGLLYNDPELGIPWPVKEASLLDKDLKWPTLQELTSQLK